MFISGTAGNTAKYREIWENLGNTGKYKISNNGLSVGSVAGMLTCWKLIKLGTKTHYKSKEYYSGQSKQFYSLHLSKSYFHKTIHF